MKAQVERQESQISDLEAHLKSQPEPSAVDEAAVIQAYRASMANLDMTILDDLKAGVQAAHENDISRSEAIEAADRLACAQRWREMKCDRYKSTNANQYMMQCLESGMNAMRLRKSYIKHTFRVDTGDTIRSRQHLLDVPKQVAPFVLRRDRVPKSQVDADDKVTEKVKQKAMQDKAKQDKAKTMIAPKGSSTTSIAGPSKQGMAPPVLPKR